MGYELLKLRVRELADWEKEMMDFYIKTGCVRDKDLERVLGDQSVGVGIFELSAEF
jgi:hypothetical protein